MEKRRSVGRPKQEPEPGERVQLSFRVTPELKRQLDAASEHSGRSQSQEAEFRLERSFDRSNLLEEVLTLVFGERPAGLLLALGVAMQAAAQMTLLEQGHRVHEDWTSDPDAYREAFNAAHTLEMIAQPAGEWSGPRRGHGNYYAGRLVRELAGLVGTGRVIVDPPLTPHTDTLRRLLGPMATRMAEELPRREKRIEEQRKRLEGQRDPGKKSPLECLDSSGIDQLLDSWADDIVQITKSTYGPCSPAMLGDLLEKLVEKVGQRSPHKNSTQRKVSSR